MIRATRQRDAIRKAFIDSGHPLGPQELLKIARKHVPNLGIATVYRTINSLVEQSWLTPVVIPGEAPRYEITNPNHHHHFRCRSCGMVFEICECPGNGKLEDLLPEGFVLESHELIFHGLCDNCH